MIGERVLLDTNLRGRVKNTILAQTHALSPLLEAVVNSIQSIDACERRRQECAVEIRIKREPGLPFEQPQKRAMERIAGFEVLDDGVGFTDENMHSFQMLDSDYKESIGCRGVGRLLWLKAFDDVTVESVFDDPVGKRMRRLFRFSEDAAVSDVLLVEADSSERNRTVVNLRGFKSRYRDSAVRTASSIASAILEHCRWTFLRDGGAPVINVVDQDESISVNGLYEQYLVTRIVADTFLLKGQQFDLSHMKINLSAAHSHTLTWGADGRKVFSQNLAPLIKGLPLKLSDEHGDFRYACFVTSKYLNNHVGSCQYFRDRMSASFYEARVSEISFSDNGRLI